jgi:hypothetical protein
VATSLKITEMSHFNEKHVEPSCFEYIEGHLAVICLFD